MIYCFRGGVPHYVIVICHSFGAAAFLQYFETHGDMSVSAGVADIEKTKSQGGELGGAPGHPLPPLPPSPYPAARGHPGTMHLVAGLLATPQATVGNAL